MKQVDTREYVSVLKGLVEEGHEVSLLIAGSSMSPFLIHQRDYIYFKQPDRMLKKEIWYFTKEIADNMLCTAFCG